MLSCLWDGANKISYNRICLAYVVVAVRFLFRYMSDSCPTVGLSNHKKRVRR